MSLLYICDKTAGRGIRAFPKTVDSHATAVQNTVTEAHLWTSSIQSPVQICGARLPVGNDPLSTPALELTASLGFVFGVTAFLPLITSGVVGLVDEELWSPCSRRISLLHPAESADPDETRGLISFLKTSKMQLDSLWETTKEPNILMSTIFLFLFQSTPTSEKAMFFVLFKIQDSRIGKMAVWEPAPQVEGLEQYMVYPDGCMKFEHEFDQTTAFSLLQTNAACLWANHICLVQTGVADPMMSQSLLKEGPSNIVVTDCASAG
ncbi:unnamed protein product [Sphagnum balticum]